MAEFADIKTGYSCNNDCIHCVIADKRRLLLKQNRPLDRTTAEVKEQMYLAKQDGMKHVVLTGGEVTIRGDVFELMDYAHKLGFSIALQTNGRMFYYKEFAEQLSKITDISYVIALHGHNAELHDSISRIKGSFNQTVQGIKNLKELNQKISGKVVISKKNYKYLTNLLSLFNKLGIKNVNMAFPHGQGNALLYFDNVIPFYSELKPYVHKTIELANKLNIWIDFEAIPFCFMQGYEKHVSELRMMDREIQLRDVVVIDLDFAQTRRNIAKKKAESCKECKYFLICEGPWREYPEKRGFGEFKPVKGKRITNIGEIESK